MDRDDHADERTIDELIEIAEEIPDKLGLAAGMAELRGTAQNDGVSVTVDVQGMLVGLDIDDEALALGPERLTAVIMRLSAEAGTSVLHDGLRAIKAGCGPEIAAAVSEVLGVGEEPAPSRSDSASARPARRQAPPDDDDEFVLVRA